MMESHLQESIDLLSKVLSETETDIDEILDDALRFQDESIGTITVDELISTFDNITLQL